MKIVLVCAGILKAGPEKELVSQYRSRLTGAFEIREVTNRKEGTAGQIKIWEGELLLKAVETAAIKIGLDEKGHLLTSHQFSDLLEQYAIQGQKSLALIIGGSNGLDESVKASCDKLLSFGRITWPHLLVRVMAVEQIYRAQQIAAGHPYHRD